MVALVGESKAGKTRCLYEVLRQRVPGAVVFAPRGGLQAVRAVVAHRRFGSRKRWSVLWLDDLESYIDPAAAVVVDALVDEVLQLPRVVVAITAGARWGLECLQDAPRLSRLIADEGHDGQQLVSVLGQALADEIGDEGLGACCVAGPRLLDIHGSGRDSRMRRRRGLSRGRSSLSV